MLYFIALRVFLSTFLNRKVTTKVTLLLSTLDLFIYLKARAAEGQEKGERVERERERERK